MRINQDVYLVTAIDREGKPNLWVLHLVDARTISSYMVTEKQAKQYVYYVDSGMHKVMALLAVLALGDFIF